jgi:integration host factor subunit beta
VENSVLVISGLTKSKLFGQKGGAVYDMVPTNCQLDDRESPCDRLSRQVDSMLKSELVQRVANKSRHLHTSDVEKVVNAVLEEILTALVRRDRVELRGFGSFAVKVRSARSGRNPKTGELIGVPETAYAAFKRGTGMHCVTIYA